MSLRNPLTGRHRGDSRASDRRGVRGAVRSELAGVVVVGELDNGSRTFTWKRPRTLARPTALLRDHFPQTTPPVMVVRHRERI